MKKYFVFSHSVATSKNKSFAGEEYKTVHGKGEYLLSAWGTHAEATHSFKYPWRNELVEYGYNREQDAKRSIFYKEPENSENWTTTVSIISLDL